MAVFFPSKKMFACHQWQSSITGDLPITGVIAPVIFFSSVIQDCLLGLIKGKITTWECLLDEKNISPVLFNCVCAPHAVVIQLLLFPHTAVLVPACICSAWAVQCYNVLFVQILLCARRYAVMDNGYTSTVNWRHFWGYKVIDFSRHKSRDTQ